MRVVRYGDGKARTTCGVTSTGGEISISWFGVALVDPTTLASFRNRVAKGVIPSSLRPQLTVTCEPSVRGAVLFTPFVLLTTSEAGMIRFVSYRPVSFTGNSNLPRPVGPLRDGGFFVPSPWRVIRSIPASEVAEGGGGRRRDRSSPYPLPRCRRMMPPCGKAECIQPCDYSIPSGSVLRLCWLSIHSWLWVGFLKLCLTAVLLHVIIEDTRGRSLGVPGLLKGNAERIGVCCAVLLLGRIKGSLDVRNGVQHATRKHFAFSADFKRHKDRVKQSKIYNRRSRSREDRR